jgi:hypothetical protein
VPGVGKPAQAVNATHRVVQGLHAYMMTSLSRLYKAIQNRGGALTVRVATRSRPRGLSAYRR